MKGLYRTELAILASLAIVLGIVGNADFAFELEREAQEKEIRPARVMREYRRELLCDCLKVHRGRHLATQVVHQRDRELCRATCIYEGGTVTKGTL